MMHNLLLVVLAIIQTLFRLHQTVKKMLKARTLGN